MAQVNTGNYPIPNSTGANVRADINENLSDLFSTSSGSTPPPAAGSATGQLWIDTSTTPDTLKVKTGSGTTASNYTTLGNIEANLGHATAASPTFTGNVGIPAGSSSSLPFRNSSDTDTGIYFGATNELDILAGNTDVHTFTSTASEPKLPLRGTNGTASAPSFSFSSDTNLGFYRSGTDTLSVTTGGSERLFVNSNGLTIKSQGDLRLADSSNSNFAAIQAPSNIGTNFTLTLPDNDGGSNDVLKSDGSGNLAWTTVAALLGFPSQSSQSGKYLTTNGSALSWGSIASSSKSTFTSNGTWNKPSSGSMVVILAWGGGGGGGKTYLSNGGGGGGGGACAFYIAPLSSLSSSYSVTVGGGGNGASGQYYASGGSGGNSSVGSLLTAYGGAPGTCSNSDNEAAGHGGGFWGTGGSNLGGNAGSRTAHQGDDSFSHWSYYAAGNEYFGGGGGGAHNNSTSRNGGKSFFGGGGGGGRHGSAGASVVGGSGGSGGDTGSSGTVPGGGGGGARNGNGGGGAAGRVDIYVI